MAARQAIGESTAAWRARGGGLNTVASRTSSSGVSAATRRQVSGLFATAKRMYAPGGEYMAGTEEQLRLGQKRSVATGMQNLAASGMAGTSMAGNLGMIYEQDVGQPTRSAANTQRLGALAGLLQAEAGAMSNLATRYSTSPGGGGGGGGYSLPGFPSSSSSRPAAQPRAATKLPTLSAFPSLTGAKKQTVGGMYREPRRITSSKDGPYTLPDRTLGSYYGF